MIGRLSGGLGNALLKVSVPVSLCLQGLKILRWLGVVMFSFIQGCGDFVGEFRGTVAKLD
jgi:hypothetical protein